jgi:hypothetical protein
LDLLSVFDELASPDSLLRNTGIAEDEPDEAVNDSFGSVHPADTMDTDPDKDPEAGGKGIEEKAAEWGSAWWGKFLGGWFFYIAVAGSSIA